MKLIISNEGCGKVDFQSSPDKKELARLSSVNNPPVTWHVPVVKEILHIRHVRLYTYEVHCERKQYTFKQTPDPEVLEDFLYQLHVLNSTASCSYMSNLAYVVFDEPEQIIRGFLLDEHPLQE